MSEILTGGTPETPPATAAGAVNAPSSRLGVLSPAEFPQGFNDWINLLGGPDPMVFSYPSTFEWPRLIRLVLIVLGLCGAVLGISLVVFDTNIAHVVFQKAPSVVLIGGALLAVGYTFFASLFGIRISMRDAFFSILFLSLPWLSLTAGLYILVRTVPQTALPWMGLVLFLFISLAPVLLTRNLCRGIRILVPDTRLWRVYCSVILSAALLMGSFVMIWIFVEFPN